ncbi:MAG: FAD-dependent oxidoreductase [Dehalococcoidia bacterium]
MTDSRNEFPHLFSPVSIGTLELKNRIVMSPVGTRLARDGAVTESLREFYVTRARGGAGLIILEPCFIEPEGEEKFLTLHEGLDVSGLSELAQAIHRHDTRVGIQLFHAGWQSGKSDARFLPPIPPADLTPERIRELIEKFAGAARMALEAGFDLIEIHAGHGYLLSQFLSPLGNQRTDEYGGDAAGRSRFVREIIRAVRESVGKDSPLSCRINGSDNLPGGTTLEDARAIAPLLAGEGLNLISVSAGALGSYPLTIPPSDTPKGCYVNLAEGVRRVVDIPVITAGRINDPYLAEDILASGKADMAAMARGLVADPDLPNKCTGGQTDRIRKCIGCNFCLDSDYEGHIGCTVNPLAGRETELEIVPAARPKKVVVIGGGLAGMETARVAAQRGHEVVLYEEDEETGGQWLLAAAPPHKQEFKELVNWLRHELELSGVQAMCGHRFVPADIDGSRPDAVVIATGAAPLIPPVPGCEREDVLSAWDVLGGRETGTNVLVVGGGATGLETAEFLAERGKKVRVIEMLKTFGSDMGGTVYFHLRNRLKKLGVGLFRDTTLKEINDRGATVSRNGEEELWDNIGMYVLALGVRSRNELEEQLKGKVKELYLVGDAAVPGRAADAVRKGFETGTFL